MAAHGGVSKSTVQRWFTLFGVQPHRQRTFKLELTRLCGAPHSRVNSNFKVVRPDGFVRTKVKLA